MTGRAAPGRGLDDRRAVHAFVIALGAEMAARVSLARLQDEAHAEAEADLREAVAGRAEAEAALPAGAGWTRVTGALAPLEREVVAFLLCLAEQTPLRRLLWALGERVDDWSTIGRLLELFVPDPVERLDARSVFAFDGALFRRRLLQAVELRRHGRLVDVELRLPIEVCATLLHDESVFGHLCPGLRVERPTESLARLVVPDAVRSVLDELIHVHRRASTGETVDLGLGYGVGTIAYFHGPAGTGKTFAARALAAEAGCALVTVGAPDERWKNASELLSVAIRRAQQEHAILLVDECDRFFDEDDQGAWTAPSLLPVLEEARGVVVLATNRPSLLDEALERRMLYRAAFPLPDAAARGRIWRSLLPADLASGVDVDALGRRFRLTGGYVKNAVLEVARVRALRPQVPIAEALEGAARRQAAVALRQYGDAVPVDEVEAPPELADAARLVRLARTDPAMNRLRDTGEVGAPVVLLCGRDAEALRRAGEALAGATGCGWCVPFDADELSSPRAVTERMRRVGAGGAAALVAVGSRDELPRRAALRCLVRDAVVVLLAWSGAGAPPAALQEPAWVRADVTTRPVSAGLAAVLEPGAPSAVSEGTCGRTAALAIAAARRHGRAVVTAEDVAVARAGLAGAPADAPLFGGPRP